MDQADAFEQVLALEYTTKIIKEVIFSFEEQEGCVELEIMSYDTGE